MKKHLATFLTTIFLLPQILLASPYHGIFGRWVAENTVWSNNVQFQFGFDFQNDATEMTVGCSFADGAFLEAAATSAVSYQSNSIQIFENRQSISQDDFHFCQVNLAPSIWTFQYDSFGRVHLYLPTPYQSHFQLVRASN